MKILILAMTQEGLTITSNSNPGISSGPGKSNGFHADSGTLA